MGPPEIFDRAARRSRRARTQPGNDWSSALADDLIDRLTGITRSFQRALVVGAEASIVDALRTRGSVVDVVDPSASRAASLSGLAVDEDRLDVPAGHYGLIMSSGCLDTVSDLPGALILMRRALAPDGLLLANFAGAPSLPQFRQAAAAADGARPAARFHPLVDVRAAGDLLVRAGYALSTADVDSMTVRYSNLAGLLDDMRAAGSTNALQSRTPIGRKWLARASDAFAELADADRRVSEIVSVITLTGWAPSPEQVPPARRGSGRTSLASILPDHRAKTSSSG